MSELQVYQARLQQVQEQIAAEKSKGAQRDDAFISELEQTEAEILAKMDEVTKQAKIEDKVQAEPVPFAVSGVDFTKLPAELITIIDLVIKADRRKIYADHEAEIEMLKAGHATDISELQKIIETGKAANATLKLEIDDLTSKLSNAATQIDELKAEINFQTAPKQDVIETEADEAAELNDAIQKLYTSFVNYGAINKVNKPDGTFELVKTDELQSSWTQIKPPSIEVPDMGGSNANGTFQDDIEAGAESDRIQTPTPPKNVGDSFPTDANDNNAMEGQPSGGDMAAKTVEERLAELEQKVTVLWKNNMVGYGFKESASA